MSEWLKEMRCKRIGYAYAGSNPAPPTDLTCKVALQAQLAQLVEHLHGKEGDVGSSPTLGSLLCRQFLLDGASVPGIVNAGQAERAVGIPDFTTTLGKARGRAR